jgi:hypothetical protein
MPAMMGMPYGFEILQTKDKISTSASRTTPIAIYLDDASLGKVLGDATYRDIRPAIGKAIRSSSTPSPSTDFVRRGVHAPSDR